MEIFTGINPDTRTAAEQLADGFKSEVNTAFAKRVREVKSRIRRIWYQNRDNDGNPSLVRVEKRDESGNPIAGEFVTDKPTGQEILQAAGTGAAALLVAAAADAQAVLAIQTQLGLNLIDPSELAAPYELAFNPDGSLLSATLRE